MAHKHGKFSSPIKGGGPKSAPFVNSNGGHANKQNMMNSFTTFRDKRQAPKPTSTGAAPDPTAKARR